MGLLLTGQSLLHSNQTKYMLKTIFILLISICALTSSYSQDYFTNDTISLKEVVCKDVPRHKYGVGTIIHKIDSLSKESHDNGNLSDLLSSTMPIFINKRSDGFSTISIRGTSANHTAILVNGMNLNSLTLGHSNLANIDMFIYDDVEVQLGSAGAIYGSDAIGGTINLKLDTKFTNGTKAIIKSDYSSLNNIFEGIKIFTGNKYFESKTRIYYMNNENRFKFTNLGRPIITATSISYPREYTNNARKENYGILQQFFYKPSLVNTFSVMASYHNNWNQIQPSMGDNSNKYSYEKSKNEFIRIITNYERLGDSYKLETNFGYVKDMEIHNGNTKDHISTQRLISKTSLEYNISATSALNFGLDYQYITPDVYSYPAELTEHRADIFLLYTQKIYSRLKYSINLRQSFVSKYKAPFTPALGLAYTLIDKTDTKSFISLKFAKGYKIPTLNQRFWGTQGDPNIKPEESISTELGYNSKKIIGKGYLDLTINSYYTNIDNWITWVNKGEWVPINERKVHCIGGEFFSSLGFYINKLKVDYKLNYFLTSSILVESKSGILNIGKQLAYTPHHNANTNLELSINDYILRTDVSYTGDRYIDGYNTQLEDYYLCHSSISKSFSIDKSSIKLCFSVNNIFNKDYQTTEYYAMPTRNYNLSLNIKIN